MGNETRGFWDNHQSISANQNITINTPSKKPNHHTFLTSYIAAMDCLTPSKTFYCSDSIMVHTRWKPVTSAAMKDFLYIFPSQTRMTASVLKQDPNTQKGSQERYLLGQNKTSKFSRQSSLSSYKMTLKHQLNGEKLWKMRWHCYLSVVL